MIGSADYFRVFLIYAIIVVFGVFLETGLRSIHYAFTKTHYKEHHFTLGKYLFYLLFPIVGLFIIFNQLGLSVLQVFVTFSVVGTVLEWLVGFTYHHVVGVRLWTYHKYALTRYTSFLSIPLWGFFGVVLGY